MKIRGSHNTSLEVQQAKDGVILTFGNSVLREKEDFFLRAKAIFPFVQSILAVLSGQGGIDRRVFAFGTARVRFDSRDRGKGMVFCYRKWNSIDVYISVKGAEKIVRGLESLDGYFSLRHPESNK